MQQLDPDRIGECLEGGGDPLGLLVGERRRALWGAVDDREVLNHARQLTTSD